MQRPLDIPATLRRRPQFLARDPRPAWSIAELAREVYGVPFGLEATPTQRETVRCSVRRAEARGEVRVESAPGPHRRRGRPALRVRAL